MPSSAERARRRGARAGLAEATPPRSCEDAAARADALVGEARATADRIRADTDRELAAATQRRDSINQQLVNVRQMLATLSGASGFDPQTEPPAPAPQAAADDEAPGRGARDQPGLSGGQDRSGVVVPLIHSSKNAVSSSPVVSSTQSK